MTEPSGDGVGTTQTSGPVVITGLEGLEAHVGQKLGVSDWKTVEQDDITTFAKLTGDEQWIHVDPERAEVRPRTARPSSTDSSPWACPPACSGRSCMRRGLRRDAQLRAEQGPLPVHAAGRTAGFRMHVELAEVKELEPRRAGAEAVYRLTYEIEGKPKPCCVADLVFRYYS